jgi:hypothetical protein
MSFILNQSATVICPHAGQATTIPTSVRVMVGGAPPLLMTDSTMVAGCPFALGGVPSPCLQVMWATGAIRVLIEGKPPLLMSSTGMSVGPGAGPATVMVTQVRVQAQ